ncbi:MAG: hypothetical protein ABH851_07170 [Methanobacteriota archaeon]
MQPQNLRQRNVKLLLDADKRKGVMTVGLTPEQLDLLVKNQLSTAVSGLEVDRMAPLGGSTSSSPKTVASMAVVNALHREPGIPFDKGGVNEDLLADKSHRVDDLGQLEDFEVRFRVGDRDIMPDELASIVRARAGSPDHPETRPISLDEKSYQKVVDASSGLRELQVSLTPEQLDKLSYAFGAEALADGRISRQEALEALGLDTGEGVPDSVKARGSAGPRGEKGAEGPPGSKEAKAKPIAEQAAGVGSQAALAEDSGLTLVEPSEIQPASGEDSGLTLVEPWEPRRLSKTAFKAMREIQRVLLAQKPVLEGLNASGKENLEARRFVAETVSGLTGVEVKPKEIIGTTYDPKTHMIRFKKGFIEYLWDEFTCRQYLPAKRFVGLRTAVGVNTTQMVTGFAVVDHTQPLGKRLGFVGNTDHGTSRHELGHLTDPLEPYRIGIHRSLGELGSFLEQHKEWGRALARPNARQVIFPQIRKTLFEGESYFPQWSDGMSDQGKARFKGKINEALDLSESLFNQEFERNSAQLSGSGMTQDLACELSAKRALTRLRHLAAVSLTLEDYTEAATQVLQGGKTFPQAVTENYTKAWEVVNPLGQKRFDFMKGELPFAKLVQKEEPAKPQRLTPGKGQREFEFMKAEETGKPPSLVEAPSKPVQAGGLGDATLEHSSPIDPTSKDSKMDSCRRVWPFEKKIVEDLRSRGYTPRDINHVEQALYELVPNAVDNSMSGDLKARATVTEGQCKVELEWKQEKPVDIREIAKQRQAELNDMMIKDYDAYVDHLAERLAAREQGERFSGKSGGRFGGTGLGLDIIEGYFGDKWGSTYDPKTKTLKVTLTQENTAKAGARQPPPKGKAILPDKLTEAVGEESAAVAGPVRKPVLEQVKAISAGENWDSALIKIRNESLGRLNLPEGSLQRRNAVDGIVFDTTLTEVVRGPDGKGRIVEKPLFTQKDFEGASFYRDPKNPSSGSIVFKREVWEGGLRDRIITRGYGAENMWGTVINIPFSLDQRNYEPVPVGVLSEGSRYIPFFSSESVDAHESDHIRFNRMRKAIYGTPGSELAQLDTLMIMELSGYQQDMRRGRPVENIKKVLTEQIREIETKFHIPGDTSKLEAATESCVDTIATLHRNGLSNESIMQSLVHSEGVEEFSGRWTPISRAMDALESLRGKGLSNEAILSMARTGAIRQHTGGADLPFEAAIELRRTLRVEPPPIPSELASRPAEIAVKNHSRPRMRATVAEAPPTKTPSTKTPQARTPKRMPAEASEAAVAGQAGRQEYLGSFSRGEVEGMVRPLVESSSGVNFIEQVGLLERGSDRAKRNSAKRMFSVYCDNPEQVRHDLEAEGYKREAEEFSRLQAEKVARQARLQQEASVKFSEALSGSVENPQRIIPTISEAHPEVEAEVGAREVLDHFFERDLEGKLNQTRLGELRDTLDACRRHNVDFRDLLSRYKGVSIPESLKNAYTATRALDTKPVVLWGQHRSSEPTAVAVMETLRNDPQLKGLVSFQEHNAWKNSDYVSLLNEWRNTEGAKIEIPREMEPLVRRIAVEARQVRGGFVGYEPEVRDAVVQRLARDGVSRESVLQAFDKAKELYDSFRAYKSRVESGGRGGSVGQFEKQLASEKGGLVFNLHDGSLSPDMEVKHPKGQIQVWQSRNIRQRALCRRIVEDAGARHKILTTGNRVDARPNCTVEFHLPDRLQEPIPGVTDDPRIQAAAPTESEIKTVNPNNPEFKAYVERYATYMKDVILRMNQDRVRLLTDYKAVSRSPGESVAGRQVTLRFSVKPKPPGTSIVPAQRTEVTSTGKPPGTPDREWTEKLRQREIGGHLAEANKAGAARPSSLLQTRVPMPRSEVGRMGAMGAGFAALDAFCKGSLDENAWHSIFPPSIPFTPYNVGSVLGVPPECLAFQTKEVGKTVAFVNDSANMTANLYMFKAMDYGATRGGARLLQTVGARKLGEALAARGAGTVLGPAFALHAGLHTWDGMDFTQASDMDLAKRMGGSVTMGAVVTIPLGGMIVGGTKLGGALGSWAGPGGTAVGAGIGGLIAGGAATAKAFHEVHKVKLEGRENIGKANARLTIERAMDGLVKSEGLPDNKLTPDAEKMVIAYGENYLKARLSGDQVVDARMRQDVLPEFSERLDKAQDRLSPVQMRTLRTYVEASDKARGDTKEIEGVLRRMFKERSVLWENNADDIYAGDKKYYGEIKDILKRSGSEDLNSDLARVEDVIRHHTMRDHVLEGQTRMREEVQHLRDGSVVRTPIREAYRIWSVESRIVGIQSIVEGRHNLGGMEEQVRDDVSHAFSGDDESLINAWGSRRLAHTLYINEEKRQFEGQVTTLYKRGYVLDGSREAGEAYRLERETPEGKQMVMTGEDQLAELNEKFREVKGDPEAEASFLREHLPLMERVLENREVANLIKEHAPAIYNSDTFKRMRQQKEDLRQAQEAAEKIITENLGRPESQQKWKEYQDKKRAISLEEYKQLASEALAYKDLKDRPGPEYLRYFSPEEASEIAVRINEDITRPEVTPVGLVDKDDFFFEEKLDSMKKMHQLAQADRKALYSDLMESGYTEAARLILNPE